MQHDWSLLPSDVVHVITQKVTIADYIRFRAVCHPWRSATSQQPLHLPPQLPWIVPLYRFSSISDSPHPFYDLSASKFHWLHLPEARWAKIRGSSHGWLVLLNGRVLSLLNPITHATIPLPPATTPPATIGIPPTGTLYNEEFFRNWDADKYAVPTPGNFTVKKTMLTSSPLDRSCLVFVTSKQPWKLAFCKIGDKRWTVIEVENNLPGEFIYDLTYGNGCLYTITDRGSVTVYDLNTPSRVKLNCCFGYHAMYVVDGTSQDILIICHGGEIKVNGVVKRETSDCMYKLISNNQEARWIRVQDIGQDVLSWDSYFRAIVFSSTNPQLPERGAKYLCYHRTISTEKQNKVLKIFYGDHSIKLVQLDDDTITDMTGNLKTLQNNKYWQKSLWLTPSLL